jgi:hypothetical protein
MVRDITIAARREGESSRAGPNLNHKGPLADDQTVAACFTFPSMQFTNRQAAIFCVVMLILGALTIWGVYHGVDWVGSLSEVRPT